jgi:molybdopterin-synthase adenylyltransferase
MPDNRYQRQLGLLPQDKLSETSVTIIGCGAVGRQVAIQLATMGVTTLQLIDPDHVDLPNLGSQGWFDNQLNQPKVTALKDTLLAINPQASIHTVTTTFNRSLPIHDVVFCCVDSITTRKFIFDNLSPALFLDGRMTAETFRVLTVWNVESSKTYRQSLFPQEEAFQGSCTARSTFYCSSLIASLMVSSFTKWLRELYSLLTPDLLGNILTNELIIGSDN